MHHITATAASIILTALCVAPSSPAPAQQPTGTAERLYVMECGQGRSTNQGRWSPGVNEGKPFDMVTNCFLIGTRKAG